MAGRQRKEEAMPFKSRSIPTAGLVIIGGLSLSACATEAYVDKHIATVNDRISALEGRVNTVDQTAQQANATAQSAAAAAQQANQRLDQLTARVDGIEQQLAAKRPRN
jgi:outer membrane murein-binding lipoprotein Lpp